MDDSTLLIRRLHRPAPELAAMTFPAYRHLLALERTSRHPEQGDDRLVDPVVFAAWAGDQAVGLALGELPVERNRPAELLSVFVTPEHRRQGVAGALLEALEEAVAAEGHAELGAVYTAGTPAAEIVERLLAGRGWGAPQPRAVSVQFAPQALLSSPIFEPRRTAVMARDLEILPWSEVTAQDLEAIRRSDQHQPWIEPNLAPWRFLAAGFDPSSVAARFEGQIMGWIINHRAAPDIVRHSCGFMHRGLARRGRIMPLWRASLERLPASCRLCTFVTHYSHPYMVRLIQRWVAPVAERVSETRGVSKALSAPGS